MGTRKRKRPNAEEKMRSPLELYHFGRKDNTLHWLLLSNFCGIVITI
jgi:hypothetical protein